MDGRIQDGPEGLLREMGWVFGLAKSLVGDSATAEDVTQDTWVAALHRTPDEGPPPRSWLAKVARNFVRQRARSEISRSAREETVARREGTPSAEQLVQRMEDQRLLADAVTHLDEPYRSAIILRYLEELSPVEIARRLELTPGIVRRRLNVGLDRLRIDLDRHFGGKRQAWIVALRPFLEVGAQPLGHVAISAPRILAGSSIMKVMTIALVSFSGWLVWPVVAELLPSSAAPPALALVADRTAAVEPTAREMQPAKTTREVVAAPDLRSVTGRVLLPDGMEPDPTLEVFALGAEMDYIGLVELLEGGRAGMDPEKLLLARSSVGSDGKFGIPITGRASATHLMLRGRYLYTELPRSIGPGDSEVVLEPVSGAWVTGGLSAPDADPIPAGVAVALIAQAPLDPTINFAWRAFDSRVATDENGRFSFRAVPAEFACVFFALPDQLAGHRSSRGGFAALERSEFEVALGHGGRLAGKVLDADGAKAVGARVKASLPGGTFGSGDYPVREALTDNDGAFVLTGVPARDVTVVASMEGHLESKRDHLIVAEGEDRAGLVLELARGASIAGVVRWPDGSVADGVVVQAEFDRAFRVGEAKMSALRGARGQTRTGADGQFQILGLGGGPFVITAEARPSEKSTVWRARIDGVQPGPLGQASSSETPEVELELSAPQVVVGSVVDSHGTPVVGYRLQAARVVNGGMGEMALDRRNESITSPDGKFRLEGLIPGRWRFWAASSDWVTVGAQELTVPSDADALRLHAVPAATVTGVVLDPLGEPMPGATIRMGRPGNPVVGRTTWDDVLAGPPVARTRADDEGRFRLDGLRPGFASLFATSNLAARSDMEQLELREGAKLSGLRLQLHAGAVLTVDVRTDEGAPAAGWLVFMQHGLSEEPRLGWTDESGRYVAENLDAGAWGVVATNESGLRFNGEQARLEDAFAAGDIKAVELAVGEAGSVTLGGIPPVDSVLVRGRLTKAGRPCSGFPIRFMPAGGGGFDRWAFGVTDAAGAYQVELDEAGAFDVAVRRYPDLQGDQNMITFQCQVPLAKEHQIDLALAGGLISGRVFGPDGAAAQRVPVSLAAQPGDDVDPEVAATFAQVFTGSDGQYAFPSLPSGSFMVTAGGAPVDPNSGAQILARATKSELVLRSGERLDHADFELDPASAAMIEVLGDDGSPVAAATVFARDRSGRVVDPYSSHLTDARGRCHYDGFAVGDYSFFARTRNLASGESEWSAVSGPAERTTSSGATQRLVLRSGTRLRLQLQDRSGKPASGSIRVLDSAGRDFSGTQALIDIMQLLEEGALSPTSPLVGPLPAGVYHIEVDFGSGKTASQSVELRGEPDREVVIRAAE